MALFEAECLKGLLFPAIILSENSRIQMEMNMQIGPGDEWHLPGRAARPQVQDPRREAKGTHLQAWREMGEGGGEGSRPKTAHLLSQMQPFPSGTKVAACDCTASQVTEKCHLLLSDYSSLFAA